MKRSPHSVEALALGLNETRPRGQVGGPAVASLSDVTRPCGLARAGTGPAPRRRAARKGIAAGAKLEGAGRYPGAPSALPRDPTQSGAPRSPHALRPRRAADRFALLRGFGLGPSAIVARRRGRCSASPCRAARCAALCARPSLRPFASASAPGGRSSSLRSSSCARSRASPCSLASPALRGPGFLPRPLPIPRAPPAPPGCPPPDLPR